VFTQRYASLLGRNDLSPSALALAGRCLPVVLACKDRILVFDQSHAAQSDWTKGHNAALGSTALYEIDPDSKSLYVRITPADPQRPALRRRLASLPVTPFFWNPIACGVAVSQDQPHARRGAMWRPKVFVAVGVPLQHHKVVIYSGLDPVTGRPGNTADRNSARHPG